MNSLPHAQAARNAAPPPVRPPFASAHAACKAHPAYAEAASIRAALAHVRNLCDAFADKYDPDTIRHYLRDLGFPSGHLSDDFAQVRRDVVGAVWVLDIISTGIDPALVLPFDLTFEAAAKGGAA